MATPAGLPDYEPMLAAYHRAFADELRTMIAGLPIVEGDMVVEIACGDGAYTPWLAERVGPSGKVVAVDISPEYLRVARDEANRTPVAHRVAQVAAPIERLPLPSGTFDLAWCAQSLYSLPDQLGAIRTMADLVRPRGTVAVLENDTIHQVVLPWPVEVELAVRIAELGAFKDVTDSARRFYVGRHLVELFRDAGLGDVRLHSFAASRQGPLGAAEREFLNGYLEDLRDRVADRLDAETRATFLKLVDPGADEGFVNHPDLTLTILDHVVTGVRPTPAASGATTPGT